MPTSAEGPRKLDGSPDTRYRNNAPEGSAAYDSRHRNPHPGMPSPIRRRNDRPVGEEGDIVNADGTLDMRFLENRVKAGLVSEELDQPEPEQKQTQVMHRRRPAAATTRRRH